MVIVQFLKYLFYLIIGQIKILPYNRSTSYNLCKLSLYPIDCIFAIARTREMYDSISRKCYFELADGYEDSANEEYQIALELFVSRYR